ncbi:NAD(P)-dependent alcohol dehydrogenase [Mycolicibacterium vaccae]|jgi:propanol-preferring alcohol dehydrogenase|uniref:alcohol dehydrogenase n=1 Tax=Mycolicibacterium vaccae ATCC 25954 TaxID=1194972 RepID=K0UH87_MYCVA|nr:NAD(P)-dependent alcohol dehydrogenase [Mycolicibacterium vaccae]ANI42949.1 alcohol dehydrogenase [Mycolicibacterium vaccae 95051]EJZ06602.1 alcohol dehydrogenase zinc-binding domain protein [Mycolicibacterium vaccae ATCC 25954]
MNMKAARIHGFRQPLEIEEVPVPEPGPGQVLLKVAAAGMCRSDYQLVDGYFSDLLPLSLPLTPGHEVAGTIAALGSEVPGSCRLAEGDLVVLYPNWGDGACRQCREGNDQLCASGQLVGFGPDGGFAEYMVAPYGKVIPIREPGAEPEFLAPLTDAGLTPYRGMKKLRDAGKLGAGRIVAVTGIGGLGAYGVQYAKLLGDGATVVALARSDEKLAVARENGADHTVNVRGKSVDDVQNELEDLANRRTVDAVLDCAGSSESLGLAASILATEGALSQVGLMGTTVELPLFPFVSGERSYFGSFWGNPADLQEVLALAGEGKIKHNVVTTKFDDINDSLEALGRGDIVGRAVVMFD